MEIREAIQPLLQESGYLAADALGRRAPEMALAMVIFGEPNTLDKRMYLSSSKR